MTSLPPSTDRRPPEPEGKRSLPLDEAVREGLARVEEQLGAWSRSDNPVTAEASRYVLRKTGKRIRPALVLLTSRLFPGESGDAVLLAALVELIHTASLIHDDIVDNSDRRRGRESAHSRWGPHITVLLGDHLYIKAIDRAMRSRYERIAPLLVETSSRMIEGELEEYAAAGDLAVTEDDHLRMVANKTAALFSCCGRFGAIAGLAGPRDEDRLARFGLEIGMSFQIIDDVLDITGTAGVLGKPVLSDLREGRITLPLIHALRTSDGDRRERLSVLVGRKDITPGERDWLLAALTDGGSLEYAMARARESQEKAQGVLRSFPGSPAREALAELADFVLKRDR